VALGASFHFHSSFPAVQQTVWHPPNQTLKDATDAAIKYATLYFGPAKPSGLN
jgi:hypothetical protein